MRKDGVVQCRVLTSFELGGFASISRTVLRRHGQPRDVRMLPAATRLLLDLKEA